MIDALLHREHTPYREIGHRSVAHVLERAGIALHQDEDVGSLVGEIEKLQPFPEVPDALAKLPDPLQAGGAVERRSRHARSGEALSPVPFDRIISVAEAGSFKPHVATYTKARGTPRPAAGSVLFVANHAFDCIGAKAAGMRTAFIDRRAARSGDAAPARHPRPDDEGAGGCDRLTGSKEGGEGRGGGGGALWRLAWIGFSPAAPSTRAVGRWPALFLFHSLLSDRASFDAVAPKLSQSFRVIVPELPGFGGSKAVGAGLAAVADRMAEAVREAAAGGEAIVLGNGYGGFVALQMAIRHPGIATRPILADCGAAFSDEGRQAFRNMAAASKAKGLSAITDIAMRRLFAPEFQEGHPDLMQDRREPS